MATPDWHRLRTFLAVVEEGSLSGAGRKLGLSQPTAGRHIEHLERSLEVRLFERTARGLQVTAAGAELAGHVSAMRARADAISRIAAGQSERIEGTVRITASELVSLYILPPILAALRDRHPEIQLEIVPSDATANLLSREADIAARMFRPTQEDLIARKMAELPVAAFAHKTYIARFGAPRTLADVSGHHLIGDDRNTRIIDAARALGFPLSRNDFAIRSDSYVVHWKAVCAGLGIGFCQKWLAGGHGDLVPVLPELDVAPLPLWLTAHQDLKTSRRIRLVFDFLAARLTRL